MHELLIRDFNELFSTSDRREVRSRWYLCTTVLVTVLNCTVRLENVYPFTFYINCHEPHTAISIDHYSRSLSYPYSTLTQLPLYVATSVGIVIKDGLELSPEDFIEQYYVEKRILIRR